MKDESEVKITNEFVGLKPKMYSILLDDSKESNTTKGVNIATEFMNLKTLCLIKKYSDTK